MSNGQINNSHHFVFDTPEQLKVNGFKEHFEDINNGTIVGDNADYNGSDDDNDDVVNGENDYEDGL